MSKMKRVVTGTLSPDNKNGAFICFYTDKSPIYHWNDEFKKRPYYDQEVNLIGVVLRFDGKFGFVGGTMDEGETPIQTAIRECEEEIGLVVKENDLVAISTFCIKTRTNHDFHSHLFAVKVSPEDMYQFQINSANCKMGRTEVLGFNVVHVKDIIIDNLRSYSWAGSSLEELDLMIEETDSITIEKHIE